MKFAEHIDAHVTQEWRVQFVDTDMLQSLLDSAVEKVAAAAAAESEGKGAEDVAEDMRLNLLSDLDQEFFSLCGKEVAKVNTFYSEKLSEAFRKYAALERDLAKLGDDNNHFCQSNGTMNESKGRRRRASWVKESPTRKRQDLRTLFSEYYLGLVLLQNYQDLNYEDLWKLLRRRDEIFGDAAGTEWGLDHVENSAFNSNRPAVDRLIRDTEATFAQGATERASADESFMDNRRLKLPPFPQEEKQCRWTTFKVGLFSGAFLIMSLSVLLTAVFNAPHKGSWKIVFRLYRGPFLVVIFLYLLGINIYGWRSAGVNHVLIFELDSNHHATSFHLLELASALGLVWTLSVLAFLYSEFFSLPAFVHPLALTLAMLAFLFNPTKSFRHGARWWLLRVLGRVFCAPCFPVKFADLWLGNQLISLAPVFADLHYLISFYASKNSTVGGEWEEAEDSSVWVDPHDLFRPVFLCLPAWFRFAQCLRCYRDTGGIPQLVNAGKYSTTFVAVFFSLMNNLVTESEEEPYHPFFYLWVLSSVVSSVYTYAWDIKMDWGLMQQGLLRKETIYSSKAFYYFAVTENMVLVFGWAATFTLVESVQLHGDLATTILLPLEVFRRFIWNFLRVENEQVNNCGRYRARGDIAVAPADTTGCPLDLITMMDEEDGVFAVRKAKGNGVNHVEENKEEAVSLLNCPED